MITKKNKVIIIAGPTAVGKTAVAIEIAKHFGTEIISADSRQCFKELNIGVARPSEEELKKVTHHFIASHSIHEKINAASFEHYALAKAEEVFFKKSVVVMTGGTGLYINAFCDGLDEIPEVPEEIRNEVTNQYKQNGLEWLQLSVKNSDPEFYSKGEVLNPQRLMRALEIIRTTGKSILFFRGKEKKQRPFEIIKLALELPKEILHHNISRRVEQMIKAGLQNEVLALLSFQHLNALQTVGYKEMFAFLGEKISLENAVEEIKRNTQQYAKRQMTWFKKDEDFTWFQPTEIEKILQDPRLH